MFSLWEFILLRKYNWFEDVSVFIPVDTVANTPDDIRLLFIVQMVRIDLRLNNRRFGFSRLSVMFSLIKERRITMNCSLIMLSL